MKKTNPTNIEYQTVTRVVYDKKTGEIVSAQTHMAIKGNKLRPEKSVVKDLIERAATQSGRTKQRLAVLKLDEGETYTGSLNCVDVKRKRLAIVDLPADDKKRERLVDLLKSERSEAAR